jgi:hypothetical protein
MSHHCCRCNNTIDNITTIRAQTLLYNTGNMSLENKLLHSMYSIVGKFQKLRVRFPVDDYAAISASYKSEQSRTEQED